MSKFKRLLENIPNWQVLSIILILAAGSLLISWHWQNSNPWFANSAQNFATEMLGAWLTFLLIDQIIGARERRRARESEERERLKRHLIRKLRSPHPEIAEKAAQMLREFGWFYDGTLEGAYLSYANWSDLDMSGINVSGARMHKVRLVRTDLRNANLEGTTVTIERLALAYALRGALMRDGRRYDGRLNLPGDLEEARHQGIDLNDEEAMARFYGVPVQDYKNGQEWACQHLQQIRARGEQILTTIEGPWWEKISKS